MIHSRLLALLLSVGALLTFCAGNAPAATNVPVFPRPGVKTNAVPKLPGSLVRTNPITAGQGTKRLTNAPPSAATAATNSTSRLVRSFRQWKSSPTFYPVVAGVAILLGLFFVARAFRAKGQAAQNTSLAIAPSKLSGKAPVISGGSISSCNVLEVGPQARQVWQFDARGKGYVLNREQTCLGSDTLPAHLVAKNWRSLFQRKLNIAWLPCGKRVSPGHAPAEERFYRDTVDGGAAVGKAFTHACYPDCLEHPYLAPRRGEPADRGGDDGSSGSIVDEFLGQLENQGSWRIALNCPLLDQLQTTAITEDGAWIYPEAAGPKKSALVAWWYKGVLQSLDLLTMPATNQPAALREQLMQMTWAGELEGWLNVAPQWHLVSDVATAEWEPALRAGLEEPIETLTPRPARELAALTARRSSQTEARANLMPPEFAIRYQQQFVDRLWMRGLLALGALYLLGVAIYMATLGYATYRTDAVEAQVAAIGPTYTNAIQLPRPF
jgi:hypothetical protein